MSSRKNRRKPARRWKTSRILTWVGFGCLAAAILALSFFAFVDGGDAEPRRRLRQTPVVSDEQQFTVEVIDNDFVPRDLTVKPGTEVTWSFEGEAAHDVTEDSGAFESGTMQEGDEYVLTFDDAGTFYYYCTLHHSMQGSITVAP